MDEARIAALARVLRRGPVAAAEIASALALSQPSVSRLLSQAQGQAGLPILRLGQARATRYLLARELGREGHTWPLYRIDALGRAERLGLLHTVWPEGTWLQAERPCPVLLHPPFATGVFPDLPWFLDDQRPQGFLGRAFVQRVAAEIGAPPDLKRWGLADILLALLRHGEDAPGDLVLGTGALQRALAAQHTLTGVLARDQRATRYPLLAEAALRGEPMGSSAGGEQPKFTALIEDGAGPRAVIVKFSERAGTPAGQRWADLLHCEHIAGRVLERHGLPAARSQIVVADGRVFLESTRFDRTPTGRRGCISLAALDAAYVGEVVAPWPHLAERLQSSGWLDAVQARALARVGSFGALIGNTDMHLGNASLLLGEGRPLTLAPVYDMLPMAWRPTSTGEVMPRELEVLPPLPEHRPLWVEAAGMALDYWTEVAAEPAVSAGFQTIARTAHRTVDAALQRWG